MLVSLDITYTLFHIDGKPLRAKLAVKLKEYRPVKVQLRETENTSPDVEKRYVVRTGETLELDLGRGLPRSRRSWREIADRQRDHRPDAASRPAPCSRCRGSRRRADDRRRPLARPACPSSYYAPEFAVEIEGEALDPASKGDVLELKVEMTFNEMTSVDVKLNNFDDTAFDLKWSDADKFRLGSRVHVKLGYADRTRVDDARATSRTLTPGVPADGPPTLTVRALDGMVRLKASKPPEDEVTYKQGHRLADRAEDRPAPRPARRR